MNKNTPSKQPTTPRKRKTNGQSTAAFAGGIAAIGSVGALIGAGLHKLFTLS